MEANTSSPAPSLESAQSFLSEVVLRASKMLQDGTIPINGKVELSKHEGVKRMLSALIKQARENHALEKWWRGEASGNEIFVLSVKSESTDQEICLKLSIAPSNAVDGRVVFLELACARIPYEHGQEARLRVTIQYNKDNNPSATSLRVYDPDYAHMDQTVAGIVENTTMELLRSESTLTNMLEDCIGRAECGMPCEACLLSCTTWWKRMATAICSGRWLGDEHNPEVLVAAGLRMEVAPFSVTVEATTVGPEGESVATALAEGRSVRIRVTLTMKNDAERASLALQIVAWAERQCLEFTASRIDNLLLSKCEQRHHPYKDTFLEGAPSEGAPPEDTFLEGAHAEGAAEAAPVAAVLTGRDSNETSALGPGTIQSAQRFLDIAVTQMKQILQSKRKPHIDGPVQPEVVLRILSDAFKEVQKTPNLKDWSGARANLYEGEGPVFVLVGGLGSTCLQICLGMTAPKTVSLEIVCPHDTDNQDAHLLMILRLEKGAVRCRTMKTRKVSYGKLPAQVLRSLCESIAAVPKKESDYMAYTASLQEIAQRGGYNMSDYTHPTVTFWCFIALAIRENRWLCDTDFSDRLVAASLIVDAAPYAVILRLTEDDSFVEVTVCQKSNKKESVFSLHIEITEHGQIPKFVRHCEDKNIPDADALKAFLRLDRAQPTLSELAPVKKSKPRRRNKRKSRAPEEAPVEVVEAVLPEGAAAEAAPAEAVLVGAPAEAVLAGAPAEEAEGAPPEEAPVEEAPVEEAPVEVVEAVFPEGAAAEAAPATTAKDEEIAALKEEVSKLKMQQESSVCCICWVAPREMLFLPCCHMCTCSGCAEQLKGCGEGCPICRGKITEMLKVFCS